ncbi:Uncharacterized protein DBV15_12888 [Temnothorax longispinosus]|uniref:Aminopeptidase N n=1 Tax=Temnothorax longispinosus TaxID=300112 RepID=A0A4S2KJE2_9HYME|nr:Uncharacterized protein DBV15_12888 [Temnothorax longispinosus]
MLQHILGDKVFRNGINTYFKRQLASVNDFWADMQTAYEEELLGEVLPKLPINIKKVMDPWIEQKSFPVLFVHVRKRYITNNGDWIVPLTNTTQEYLNFIDNSTIKWLDPGKSKLSIDLKLRDNWIIFNIQQTGKY